MLSGFWPWLHGYTHVCRAGFTVLAQAYPHASRHKLSPQDATF
jgi:hypothetical protein